MKLYFKHPGLCLSCFSKFSKMTSENQSQNKSNKEQDVNLAQQWLFYSINLKL
jgi:hypothetical protein